MAVKRKAGASKVKSARAKVSKRAKRRAALKARPKPRALEAAPSARAKPKRAMFQKVAFTMFSVSDPTRARNFYERVLGLERGLAAPNGVWTEYDLPGGGCLALFCHPDPKAARAPGGASIAFEVADLDALNERLAAEGVVYQGDVVHGPNCRMSNILDSEGNAIILHELSRAN
jgi:catechol 2,3-dioxygenase-like lactoylglutathione lyase family enzyme